MYYALDYNRNGVGSLIEAHWPSRDFLDSRISYIPAAICHVFGTADERDRWIEDDPHAQGRRSRTKCDAKTARTQIQYSLYTHIYSGVHSVQYREKRTLPTAQLVKEYATIRPECMHISSKQTGLAGLRAMQGMKTRRELSDKCGISIQRLCDWETGARDPKTMSFESARKLATALNTTLDELWENL